MLSKWRHLMSSLNGRYRTFSSSVARFRFFFQYYFEQCLLHVLVDTRCISVSHFSLIRSQMFSSFSSRLVQCTMFYVLCHISHVLYHVQSSTSTPFFRQRPPQFIILPQNFGPDSLVKNVISKNSASVSILDPLLAFPCVYVLSTVCTV